jgi:hypothetical protein
VSETILTSFTPAGLRDLLQQAGYRAELMTDRPAAPYLRSAAGGIPFELQLVNHMPGGGEGYADISFAAALLVQGEMKLALVNDWNNSRRFARLRWIRNMAVLDMDVSVLGGMTQAHLQALIAIWDQLLQDIVPFLRNAFARIAAANSTPRGKAAVALPADAAVTEDSAAVEA